MTVPRSENHFLSQSEQGKKNETSSSDLQFLPWDRDDNGGLLAAAHDRTMTQHLVLTVGLECSEEGGEQGAADADVHQLGQGVQSQLRGEVIEERVGVLSLVLFHQLDQVLHRGRQSDTDTLKNVMRD